MKKSVLFFLFSFIVIKSFSCFAQENPLFKIVPAPHKETILLEQNNPQYQKTKHNSNSTTRKFNSLEIQNKNCQNVQEFLTSEGFVIMTTGGVGAFSSVSYKGYTGFCIKVYIDGILCNNSSTGEFDWNSLDINSIETIEIEDMPSVSETEFAGCIIKITTKNGGEKLLAKFFVGGYRKNFFDTWNSSIYYSNLFEKFNYNLGVSLLFAANEYDILNGKTYNQNNFSKQGNINYGWNYNLTDNSRIYGSNMFFYNNIKTNNSISLNTGLEEDIETRNNFNYSISKNNFKSDTSFFYNFSNVKYTNNFLQSDIDNTNFNKFSLTENCLWIFDFFGELESEFIPNSSKSYRFSQKMGISKSFLFKNLEFEPQLVCIAWQDYKANFAILPRLSASLEGFTIGFFREFILPTFNQLYWPNTSYATGNLNLKPEDGWCGFLGFKRENFPLWAQYKIAYYTNKIRWSTLDGKLCPINNGNGLYNTISLGFTQSFFKEHFFVSLDGSYVGAKLTPSFKQIMWVPEWQAHANITASFNVFVVSADYSFIDKRWANNENTYAYPAYHLVDLNVTISISPSLQMFFKINNLLDQQVVYHDNYYIPSRKVSVGINFKH